MAVKRSLIILVLKLWIGKDVLRMVGIWIVSYHWLYHLRESETSIGFTMQEGYMANDVVLCGFCLHILMLIRFIQEG